MEVTLLQKDTMIETYNDMENLINKTVWEFYKKYGGDFEEWKAEANLSFIRAFNTHKKNKSSFSTWLYFCIWKGLLTYANTLYKQIPYPYPIEDNDRILRDRKNHSFSSLELLDGVQEDTKLIIFLIWNPPKALRNINTKTNGHHPCHMQVVLRNYLFKLGWTGRKIRESFEEITRIIND